MTTIYTSHKVDINYNAGTERAEIVSKGSANPISFALIKNTQDSSCWDNFTTFILKHFTWTWISVKDDQGNDTNQIANITSIAKHVGLTPKEIKTANKAGNLFLEIDRKLNCTFLPKADSLDQLMRTNVAMLNFKGYVVDDSSETNFLQTLAASYQKDWAIPDTMGMFFASFAIKHFKYVDVAEDWMKTTFDEGYVSVNKFQQADISCFKRSSASIRINMQIELNKLK